MDMSTTAKKYGDAIKGDSIDVESLMKLPELANCGDWSKVVIMGKVDYISERTKANYNGLLVKYSGGLYYIKKNVVTALEKIDSRFKKVNKTIKTT